MIFVAFNFCFCLVHFVFVMCIFSLLFCVLLLAAFRLFTMVVVSLCSVAICAVYPLLALRGWFTAEDLDVLHY